MTDSNNKHVPTNTGAFDATVVNSWGAVFCHLQGIMLVVGHGGCNVRRELETCQHYCIIILMLINLIKLFFSVSFICQQ